MIVRNLNIFGIRARPHKTNTPLIVDANAVLPFPVAGKFFQPIAGR